MIDARRYEPRPQTIVVEIDANSRRAFCRLAARHGGDATIFATPRATTASGGWDVYFRAARPVRNTKLADGVKLRVCVAPPLAREYRWALGAAPWQRSLADAPDWLLDPLRPVERPGSTQEAVQETGGSGSVFAQNALEREISRVAASKGAERGPALFEAAAKLGSLAAGGFIAEHLVTEGLLRAASACGVSGEDGNADVAAIIASGIARGRTTPRPQLTVVHGGRSVPNK